MQIPPKFKTAAFLAAAAVYTHRALLRSCFFII